MPQTTLNSAATDEGERLHEVHFEHSLDLVGFLDHLGISLLISTYQAGKLVNVHTRGGKLSLDFHHFQKPMGIAVSSRQLAIGAGNQIWFLRSAPEVAKHLPPAGQHDACFVTRSSHVTGDIQVHEMGWVGEELWLVNTLFSCLCTLRPDCSFVPRWKPPFVTELAAEDRCHLNGMALGDRGPRFVTALGETNSAGGWRSDKAQGGCIVDVDTGELVLRALCMPHSPRLYDDALWFLDSGRGRLARLPNGGTQYDTVCELPGYTRGLVFVGPYAVVGLSRIRETSTFGGVPISENRERLKCGVWVVDCRTGSVVVFLEFKSGVEEIFAVQILPQTRCPALEGPNPSSDSGAPIWIVPPQS